MTLLRNPSIWQCARTTGALAFLLMIGAGCNRTPPEAPKMLAPKVTVSDVANQETVDFDEYTGRAEASEKVEVRARVFGYLKSIDFEEGKPVTKGQKLFTIEPDEYQAIHNQSLSRINVAKTEFELSKTKLARRVGLVRTGAVTQEEYDESAATVKETEAKVAAAQSDADRTAVDLKHTVLRAEISGRIDRPYVTRGNLLAGGTTSGTLLTKIVKEQPMYVYFDVDERSLLRYLRQRPGGERKPGELRSLKIRCYAQLADEKNYPHQGFLDFASTEVEATTGTNRLRGVFKNKNNEIISGMFVRIRIPVSKPYQALLIPEAAIASDQSLKYVYVVGNDNTASRRPVVLGNQRGELRIITSGLKTGERVIVKGLQRVKQGMAVEAEVVPLPTPEKMEALPPEEPIEEPEAPPAEIPPTLDPVEKPATNPGPVPAETPPTMKPTPQPADPTEKKPAVVPAETPPAAKPVQPVEKKPEVTPIEIPPAAKPAEKAEPQPKNPAGETPPATKKGEG